ncbi:MAG: hypothetical protein ABIA47_04465 [bacterium]
MKIKIDPNIEKELNEVTSRSDFSPKCGALIVRDVNILASGFAYNSTKLPEFADSEDLVAHGEESALMNALNDKVDVAGADMYVLLIKKNGQVRYTDASYSCVTCSRIMSQTKIANVVYPVPDGWEKISVEEMFEKAIDRVREMQK